ESAAHAEQMRPVVHARPEVRYASSRSFVQGDEAALLGQFGNAQFLSMCFVKEDGHWKVRDEVFSDQAYHPNSVYALVPQAAGAFARANSPWQNTAAAFDRATAAKRGWQMRATYDE